VGEASHTVCIMNSFTAPPPPATLHWFKFLDDVASDSSNAYTLLVDGVEVGNTAISAFGNSGSWVTTSLTPGVHTLSENVPAGVIFERGRCVIADDEMDIDANAAGAQYFWGPWTGAVESDGSPDFVNPDLAGPENGSITVDAGDEIYCVLYNVTLPPATSKSGRSTSVERPVTTSPPMLRPPRHRLGLTTSSTKMASWATCLVSRQTPTW